MFCCPPPPPPGVAVQDEDLAPLLSTLSPVSAVQRRAHSHHLSTCRGGEETGPQVIQRGDSGHHISHQTVFPLYYHLY